MNFWVIFEPSLIFRPILSTYYFPIEMPPRSPRRRQLRLPALWRGICLAGKRDRARVQRSLMTAIRKVVLGQFRFLRNNDSDSLTFFGYFAGFGTGIGAKMNKK